MAEMLFRTGGIRMNAREAIIMLIYILTEMLIISIAIVAVCYKDYEYAVICGIVSLMYSMIIVHEYKRGTWK